MFKAPKIDDKPKKQEGIYPHVTTWDVTKEYIKLTKPYAFMTIVIVLCGILGTIFQSIVIPIFYKKFFDLLPNISPMTGDISSLLQIIYIVLGINILVWAIWRLYNILEVKVQTYVKRDSFQMSFEYLIEHSYSFFTNNFTGALVQKINRFARSYDALFDNILFELLVLFIKVVGTMVVLYVVNPIFAYGMLGWAIIFMFISYLFTKYKLKFDVEAAAVNSKLTGATSDAIGNQSSIQAFSAYTFEGERVKEINEKMTRLNIFRYNLNNIQNSLQSFTILAIEFFIFYFGVKYWHSGLISIGTFVLAQAYIINISNSLWGFGRIMRNIYEAFADAKEMVEILHLKHEIADKKGAEDIIVKKGLVEFKNVTFGFGKNADQHKKIFDGINIDIRPGEKVALIGTSGAGKSTLVKLLLRLYDVQGGEILIDGQNIKNVTQKSLRNNISLVPQDPALFHRALMENIRYGRRDASDAEVMNAAKLAHCDVFINEFPNKYETLVGERGVKLSGGERQRVAIARAILKNAPILVLDEATSSLDSHSEALIQDALNTLMKGKTTIVIAHRLSTIRNMDRIIVVTKNGVAEEGSHEELLKNPNGLYAKLWSLQAGGFSGKSIEELLEV